MFGRYQSGYGWREGTLEQMKGLYGQEFNKYWEFFDVSSQIIKRP
jgi:hypothetical protein